MKVVNLDTVLRTLEALEKDACTCDLLYGVTCEIHAKFMAQSEALKTLSYDVHIPGEKPNPEWDKIIGIPPMPPARKPDR